MKIVDGMRPDVHITSQQVADVNSALVGLGDYVLSTGERFRCELVSSNLIKIYDGAGMMQGRRFVTPNDGVDDLAIENGTPGATRKDLIVARYTIDTGTLVEDIQLVVVKGTNNAGDPVINSGTVIRDGANIHDFALYRVNLSGITITGVNTLFTPVSKSLTTLISYFASGILPVANGGSGRATSPSLLTDLASGSAANVFQASPRPGVTGVLPLANGGTGQTTPAGVRNVLGLGGTVGPLPVANGGTGASGPIQILSNIGIYRGFVETSSVDGRASVALPSISGMGGWQWQVMALATAASVAQTEYPNVNVMVVGIWDTGFGIQATRADTGLPLKYGVSYIAIPA